MLGVESARSESLSGKSRKGRVGEGIAEREKKREGKDEERRVCEESRRKE